METISSTLVFVLIDSSLDKVAFAVGFSGNDFEYTQAISIGRMIMGEFKGMNSAEEITCIDKSISILSGISTDFLHCRHFDAHWYFVAFKSRHRVFNCHRNTIRQQFPFKLMPQHFTPFTLLPFNKRNKDLTQQILFQSSSNLLLIHANSPSIFPFNISLRLAI
jgi:hypothetical protein